MFTCFIRRAAALAVLLALFLAVGAFTGVAQTPGSLAMNSGFEEGVSEQSAARVQETAPAPALEEEPAPMQADQASPTTGLAEQTGLIIAVIVVVIAIVVIVTMMRRRR